jgi:ethanolamine utilization protein EutN
MRLAEVLGTVVASEKHPDFAGLKLLICQPTNAAGEPEGASQIAVDTVQAGVGDRVLILREGTGARQIFGAKRLAIRSVIVGVVDQVDIPAPA